MLRKNFRDRRAKIFEEGERLAQALKRHVKKTGGKPIMLGELLLRFEWSPRQLNPRLHVASALLRKEGWIIHQNEDYIRFGRPVGEDRLKKRMLAEKGRVTLVDKYVEAEYRAYQTILKALERLSEIDRFRKTEYDHYFKALQSLRVRKRSEMVKKDGFQTAETWADQDRLARELGSECYAKAQSLIEQGDLRQAGHFLRLAGLFLRLAHLSKKEADLDEIDRRLTQLEERREGKEFG